MSVFAPLLAAPRFVRAPAAVDAPVPPLVTANGVFSVRALNVGALLTLISCTVFTAPFETLKFEELKLAIPLLDVEASSMVIVEPAADELFNTIAPLMPFNESTAPLAPPPPVVQLGHDMLPFASIVIGPLALTATVPEAFGRTIDLFDPLGAENNSEFVIPPS